MDAEYVLSLLNILQEEIESVMFDNSEEHKEYMRECFANAINSVKEQE